MAGAHFVGAGHFFTLLTNSSPVVILSPVSVHEREIPMTKHTNNQAAHIPVSITADTSGLSVDDLGVMMLLIQAAKHVDNIYLLQCGQYGREENVPFDGSKPKTFYSSKVTVAGMEAYIEAHPDERDALLSPFSTVGVDMFGHYYAEAYAVRYKSDMERVSDLLSKAAARLDDSPFKTFLELRSRAFMTNQYRESDIAWIHANNGPFEFTVGPYESYADKLFGVKRTFESILGVVLARETEMAQSFQTQVSKFDAFLGQRYGYPTKTTLTPMVVMDEVYASGEAIYDYVPMAYNLPNDRDIHAEVGSKKVFIRNVMAAKFEHISKEIARRTLSASDAEQFDFDTYLRFVIGHESAHGLSFHFDGSVFGPVASAIEEGKADVFGMWFLYYMADIGLLDKNIADVAVMENLNDGLRQIRFGVEEAHAVGAIVQLNWFMKEQALVLTDGGFTFDSARFRDAVMSLGDELYLLAIKKDQALVEAFAATWGKEVPEAIEKLLPRLADIPVDIDPVFTF